MKSGRNIIFLILGAIVLFCQVSFAEFEAMELKNEEAVAVVLEIPPDSYTKEEIDISCKNEVLTISAEKKHEEETKQDGYIRKERYFGRRERSFSLKGLDQDTIDASLSDGVLKIDVKKDEKYIEDKTIQIK